MASTRRALRGAGGLGRPEVAELWGATTKTVRSTQATWLGRSVVVRTNPHVCEKAKYRNRAGQFGVGKHLQIETLGDGAGDARKEQISCQHAQLRLREMVGQTPATDMLMSDIRPQCCRHRCYDLIIKP